MYIHLYLCARSSCILLDVNSHPLINYKSTLNVHLNLLYFKGKTYMISSHNVSYQQAMGLPPCINLHLQEFYGQLKYGDVLSLEDFAHCVPLATWHHPYQADEYSIMLPKASTFSNHPLVQTNNMHINSIYIITLLQVQEEIQYKNVAIHWLFRLHP